MNTELRLLVAGLTLVFSIMCFHLEGTKREKRIEEAKTSSEYEKAKDITFSIMNCIGESSDFCYYNNRQNSGWKTKITVIWWIGNNEKVYRGTLIAKDNRAGIFYQNYNVEPFRLESVYTYDENNKGGAPINVWGSKKCIEQINLIRER